MKLLLCTLAIWYFAQVEAKPSVVYQCIRSDYTDNQGRYATGAMNMHLRVNSGSEVPMYIYAIGKDGLDVDSCYFDGKGTTADPYDLKITVDISLTPTFTDEHCGLRMETQDEYSGTFAETDYFLTWLIRIRKSKTMLSKSDFLYKIKCDTTNSPSDFQYAYPVGVTDIVEVELHQVVCVPNIRVLHDGNIVYQLTLGDLIEVEAYAICTDTSSLTPTGVFYTQLQVSNTDTFTNKLSIIDAFGCPYDDLEAFRASFCSGGGSSVTENRGFSELWYSCGLMETFSFADEPQLILHFRALLDFCYDNETTACTEGACHHVTGGPARKKRATKEGEMKPKFEDVGVLILPFGEHKIQEQQTCVESNIFIAVFAVMCVLLLVVSAASVYLVLKLNKRSRKEIERLSTIQMGKVNPAF